MGDIASIQGGFPPFNIPKVPFTLETLQIIFPYAAIVAGVVIAALVFAWENALRIRARKHTDEHGIKHYEIYGPLFFGSVMAFNEKFEVADDPEEVIIDFKESRITDMSAIEAVNKLTERYAALGKRVHLRHLSRDCQQLLKDADSIIEVNIMEDPTYKVLVNKKDVKRKQQQEKQ